MGCKYNLMYHIILVTVTKYRKRLLITYGDFIKKCVEEISLKYRFNIECMKDRINVAELLRNCPEGMELDCTMYDDVFFYEITDDPVFPIHIKRIDGPLFTLTKYGEYANCPSAKCVIFPKGKTTWEGFQRPFKDGDIISDSLATCIFKGEGVIKGTVDYYCGVHDDYFNVKSKYSGHYGNIDDYRLATEEEKQKLFQAIKDNGYKWNCETKTLEELIEPRFKVGDRIKHKTHIKQENVVTEIKDTYYILDDKSALSFTFQDEYELVPDKFDITTLKPFESKVLVRNDEHQYWIPAFWGFKEKSGYTTTFGWCRYCIPYKGNEHLFETNNDCDKFYKTWE